MDLSSFNYNLPPELIATEPAQKRDQSRLLVLDKKTGEIEHQHFFDIINSLEPGDLLIANNSKVIPARLTGKKTTGGEVEVFLSKNLGNQWECLIKGRVRVGTEIILSDNLTAEIEVAVGDGEHRHRRAGRPAFDARRGDPCRRQGALPRQGIRP